MKEEKIMILTMLEEGKITSEEAIKLLEALEDEDYEKQGSSDEFKKEKEDKYNFKETFDQLEDIGSDIGNAISTVFDGLMDFGSSFTMKNNYQTVTDNLDMDLSGIESPSLDLKAVNGEINLRPTDGEVLYVKATCQYKKGLLTEDEAYFTFNQVGDKIVFSPKYSSNISIKLDLSIPEKSYNEVVLNTSNGKIYIHGLKAKTLRSHTSNSAIEIEDGNIEFIDLTTKNGKIEIKDTDSQVIKSNTTNSTINLENINSNKIACKTSNSQIQAKLIDAKDISLTSSNGKIFLGQVNISNAENIDLITSNNSIICDLHDINKETIFDLETSMGNIDLGLQNLIYTTNKQVNLGLKKIVANTLAYDINKDHLKFKASTSNGSIKIN